MDEKEFVLAFVRKHHLAVLATAEDSGQPEAAVLGFAATDAFELIFNTSNTTRKYRNLRKNPRVAVVIGGEEGQTVQYEGIARELEGDEENKYKQIMYSKNPASRKHEADPDERHFVVTPRWLRYTDESQQPPYIVELPFEQ